MAYRLIVIGGANADISGIPSCKLIARDSNPGTISVSPGGVGRNIAEHLRSLGAEVSFIGAFGDDVYGDFLRKNCEELGIDISMSRVLPGRRSSVYMYISDETGDMYAAVNDMKIVDEISPDYLSMFDLNAFDACVVDANLSRETLEYICGTVKIPLYADPVSCAKAPRLSGLRFTAVKPNRMELGYIDPCCADRVYVSRGKLGITASGGGNEVSILPPRIETDNATGAGDSATAAIVFGELSGMDLAETTRFAVEYSAGIISKNKALTC